MPPKVPIFKFQKCEALNYGIQLGQMEVLLTFLVEKVHFNEELCNKGKELMPLLEMLKMSFRAKCLRRTANFDEEITKLNSLDKNIFALLDAMKKLNIRMFDLPSF